MTILTPPDAADRREETVVSQNGVVEQREQIVVDEVAERRQLLYRVSQFIWLAAGCLESLLGLRIVLKMIAANPNAGFAQFVYALSTPFLLPFNNLTTNPSAQGMVFEVTSIIAMAVYALLALVVVQGLWVLFFRAHTRSLKTYRRTS
jgi:hypothetical protein